MRWWWFYLAGPMTFRQFLKQEGWKYQLSAQTPVRAFLIRTSFMRFPHKHPSIYETGRRRGGMPKAGWIAQWQARALTSSLSWSKDSWPALKWQPLDSSYYVPSPRRLAWHGAAGWVSLGPKNCVNIWISLSLRVQRRLDWQSPTKTLAISAQVQHRTRRQICPLKLEIHLTQNFGEILTLTLVLLTSPIKFMK